MTSVRILDTRELPWQEFFAMPGMRMKELARDRDGTPNTYLCWGPPGPLLPESRLPYRHFHRTVREFMYVLAGELPHHEWDGPEDSVGHPTWYGPGYFMDRPPGSIHGVAPGRAPRVGRVHLDWRTGPGVWPGEPEVEIETVEVQAPAPGAPGTRPPRAADDPPGLVYARDNIRIYDTNAMAWEEHGLVPGSQAKRLACDDSGREAVVLLWLPPGARAPRPLPGRDRFAFVLQGDLLVDAETCREGVFIHHPHGAPDGLDRVGAGPTGATLLVWRDPVPAT